MDVHILDIKVTCSVFCNTFSTLDLPFELHFSYSDHSASIAITKKGEPDHIAALLLATDNTICVIKKTKSVTSTFDDLLEFYANLLLICCDICNVNTSKAIRATLDCIPSKMLPKIIGS